jgi:hypothetical protein
MSVPGTTRTFRNVRYLVAIGVKADIERASLSKTRCWPTFQANRTKQQIELMGRAGHERQIGGSPPAP